MDGRTASNTTLDRGCFENLLVRSRDGLYGHDRQDLSASHRSASLIVIASLLGSAGWLLLVFILDPVRFVVHAPAAKSGFEAFLAIGQLFGAFVLFITPTQSAMVRMRWVASGFLMLSVGTFVYGILYPAITDTQQLAVAMYGSLFVRTVSVMLMAVGLVPERSPSPRRSVVLICGSVLTLLVALIPFIATHLPSLISLQSLIREAPDTPQLETTISSHHLQLSQLDSIVSGANTSFPGLTTTYVAMALVPFAISLVVAVGAARRAQDPALGAWLLVSVALFAGAQLHTIFWPSMYSSLLSRTSVIRFAVAATIVVGGLMEFRRVVAERAALLAAEQEHVRRLEDLTQLRADFTSMVAHELATPLAAISNLSQIVSLPNVSDSVREESAATIASETRLLQSLVKDVRQAAEIERDDFRADVRCVPVQSLIDNAAAYARSVDISHPFVVDQQTSVNVLADPERIGQVLRNLLNNAVKHTPRGTRVTIRAREKDRHVVIEVTDTGQGIAPVDQRRIFEKFGRGQSPTGGPTPGRGLGLYLSRRILRSHGTDLTLVSTPGQGATFRFDLECSS